MAQKESLDERLKSLRIDRGPAPNRTGGGVSKKAILAGVVAVLVVAILVTLFVRSRPKTVSVAEVKTDAAGTSAGQTALTASGYVVAAHKISVGAKVLGRVAWIGVEKGDHVTQGQLLVKLEDTDYRAQVAQAQAGVAAARARVDELRAGSRPQEKQQGRAAVAQAQANLRNAEADYERARQLAESGITSKADLDRATTQRDVARAQLDSARQGSAITDVGPRVEQVRAAEALTQQAQASLDYARVQLANTEILAPVTGTILERIVERGEVVTPSAAGESGARTSVVSLADLADLRVELDISQTDFARLGMGQRAEIIPEAYPDKRYSGYIYEIAPEANRAKATVQIKVKVDNPDESLRPEMNARVNFLAEAKPGAQATAIPQVLVPQSAVQHEGENAFVYIVKGDVAELRTVRVGEASGEYVAVLDGLSGGERVVTSGAAALGDGDRVVVGNP